MTQPTSATAEANGAARDQKVDLRSPRTPADQAFRSLLFACASTVLIIIALIVLFLLSRAGPAWRHAGLTMFTRDNWGPRSLHPTFGILGDLLGSLTIAAIALVFAFPISIATALAINEYVPRATRRMLTALVDLLAAIPSLVYGLWGKYFLDHHLFRTSIWLGGHANFFPLFRLSGTNKPGGSIFLAGLVVAIMILPLVTSISREVMSQVPREDCEAALALGGTRWGMVTTVIFPFARSGVIGAAMLGLGRALGETIAVSLVLLSNEHVTSHILQPGGGSVAALIVRDFAGSSTLEQSALTMAGLALFAVTLSINVGARIVVSRTGKYEA